jgi:hypothetical protein
MLMYYRYINDFEIFYFSLLKNKGEIKSLEMRNLALRREIFTPVSYFSIFRREGQNVS